jgi:CelD/BcsL family acetyltransferase involved in cellulose biosynthesis
MEHWQAQQALAAALARAEPGRDLVAPAAASSVPLSLSFDRFRADAALVQDWRRLDNAAALPTQSHAFTAALADTLLAGTDLRVFAASGADGLAALLPLCRDSGPFARWRLAGADEVFEPVDLLCRDAAAARDLALVLARQSRPLDLDRIPSGSPLIPALQAAMKGSGLVSIRPSTPSPTITLDAGWHEPDSQFNAGRRSDFRRAARRAQEQGEIAFEILSPGPDEFDALFDEAVAVELRSWKREAGTAIAVDPAKERFFRAFLRAASEAGSLRIAFLRIGGRIVAMQMALESRGRYWLFKIGFDEAYSRCSPGTLLMLHMIGWAARRGLVAFELLGDVEPWIAQFWTREQHDCVRLRTYPFNPAGAAAFAADGATWLRRRLTRRAEKWEPVSRNNDAPAKKPG